MKNITIKARIPDDLYATIKALLKHHIINVNQIFDPIYQLSIDLDESYEHKPDDPQYVAYIKERERILKNLKKRL